MFLPSNLFPDLGYNAICENFFRVQGGVFHLVMVVLYYLAFKDPVANYKLVFFSIIVKLMATVFLFTYFLIVDSIIVVLLSGFGDMAMGLITLYLYKKLDIKNINSRG